MDPAVLLQPKEEDAPSGANLEYDPAFTDMELAAQPGEETVIGDERTEATDPDYREVAVKATEVLERSHDLRAAVFLADALLQSEGLSGFADVTTFMRGCLEQYWDTCHPELDEDDGDPIMRINAVIHTEHARVRRRGMIRNDTGRAIALGARQPPRVGAVTRVGEALTPREDDEEGAEIERATMRMPTRR